MRLRTLMSLCHARRSHSHLEDIHLKGVVLLYDHFLSLHWDTYCNIPREKFLEDFRNHGLHAIKNYPEKAQNVINSVVNNRQLASYEHMDGVVAAFGRIDKRLFLIQGH